MNNKQFSGFSLTELLVVIALIGIIASIAIPSFQGMIEKNRLKAAIESLAADLMFARTEAIKRSTNLDVSISIDGASWCYGIDNDNTHCDCSTADDCAIKTVKGSLFSGTILDADDNTTFDFRRGSAKAIGSTLSTRNYSARVRVSSIGRVRICIPAGSTAIRGYDGC